MTGNPSMYERAMDGGFERLDPAVQRFHRLVGRHEMQGWVETAAPHSWPARLLGRCLGTPLEATTGPIRFTLDAQATTEVWIRRFPHRTMSSRLQLRGRQIVETLGLSRLHFELREREGALVMRLLKVRFVGLPCPRWLMPQVIAEEAGHGDRLQFRVQADVPWLGRIAQYHGHLVLPKESN